MPITAATLIQSLRTTLLDPAPGVAWFDPDLLAKINTSQRNLCLLRPDLFTVRGPITLVAGTLQKLPVGGTVLYRLDENAVGGRRCRLVDAALLDAASGAWPAGAVSPVVDEYCVDKDEKRFHVMPPNDGSGSVIGHYAAEPPVVVTTNDTLALDAIYELPLMFIVLSEAYAANTKRQDTTKAAYYRDRAEKMLGIDGQAKGAAAPKYGATPGGA